MSDSFFHSRDSLQGMFCSFRRHVAGSETSVASTWSNRGFISTVTFPSPAPTSSKLPLQTSPQTSCAHPLNHLAFRKEQADKGEERRRVCTSIWGLHARLRRETCGHSPCPARASCTCRAWCLHRCWTLPALQRVVPKPPPLYGLGVP